MKATCVMLAIATANLALSSGTALAATVVKHTLAFTVINSGAPTSGQKLVNGYNKVDAPVSISCANSAGCTVAFDAMAVIEAPSTGSINWGVCGTVDGSPSVSPGNTCWLQGSVAQSQTAVGVAHANKLVKTGTHTIQTQVYAPAGSILLAWQFNYSIYDP